MEASNIRLLDMDLEIEKFGWKEVTSPFIKDPSSSTFHAEGLFSEEIFGQIGSPERILNCGYINLNTEVLHPQIYINLIRLKRAYGDIMAGTSKAIFNKDAGDFEIVGNEVKGADTGFSFFMEHFLELKFNKTNSTKRTQRINTIERYKEKCIYDSIIVIPAGNRDMNVEDEDSRPDEINKLYMGLLNYVGSMPVKIPASMIILYDNPRFAIQRKVNDIYNYIFNIFEGKGGLLQRKFGSRNLALGTRNVVSSPIMSAPSPTSPQYFKPGEIKLPLFQVLKANKPIITHHISVAFFNYLFQQQNKAMLIDPKDLTNNYREISIDEYNLFNTSDGVGKLINLFMDREFRELPAVCQGSDKKNYYLYLVFDNGEDLYIFNNLKEFKENFKHPYIEYDESKVRPITWIELFYIAAFSACDQQPGVATRYPVIVYGSTVPNKAHLISTPESRMVKLHDVINTTEYTLPHYPIFNTGYVDSMSIHPGNLKGFNADHDGDVMCYDSVLTDEAKTEIRNHMDSNAWWISPNNDFTLVDTDLINLQVYNMTKN